MLLNMRRLDMIKDVPYPAQPEKPLLYAIISHHKKVGSALLKKKRFLKKGMLLFQLPSSTRAVTYVVTVECR